MTSPFRKLLSRSRSRTRHSSPIRNRIRAYVKSLRRKSREQAEAAEQEKRNAKFFGGLRL